MARRSMTAGETTKAQGRKAIKRKRSVAPKAARRSVSSAVGQRAEIARLKRELAARNSAYSEQVEHQAATIDVLKAMSASPGDPQPVFDLIVERARDLCEAYGVTVLEFDGALIHWRAATGVSEDPKVRKAVEALYPAPATNDNPSGRAILTR